VEEATFQKQCWSAHRSIRWRLQCTGFAPESCAEVNGRPRGLPGRPGPGRAVNRSGKRGKDARARLVDGVMEATLTAEAPPL